MAGGIRNLEVDIDGNPSGFDRACDEAGRAARTFDRELERLERAQRQQERSAQASTRATQQFSRATSDSAIASRKAGLAAQQAGERSQKAQDAAARAAERASVAQQNAADAAQALERGEITAAEAAQAQARAETALARSAEAAANAERQLERANIAAAVAARAAAKAANEQAEEERKAAEAAVQAAAMERLAHLRASGSVREHNDLLRRMRQNYSDFGRDTHEMSNLATRAFGLVSRAGTSAMESISGGVSGLAQSWPALLAMVVAGIVALPIVAIAAGGAITLAIGGALAGLGILAVASSAEVKSAFSGLATDAKKQAAQWAAPFKPVLVKIANDWRDVLGRLGPTMTAVFARIAPAVQRFGVSLGHSFEALAPSLTIVGDNFAKLLDAIGPQLPGLMEAVGNGIASIAQAAGDHAAEFAQLITVIGQFVNGLGQMIGWLINAGSAVQRFFGLLDGVAGKPKAAATGLDAMGAASGRNAMQTQLMGGALNIAATSMELASLSAADLKTKLDSLTGKALSAREAAAAYATSIFAMNKSLHDNGGAHGYATAKGVANEQALTNLAKAANANAEAMRADNASTKEVSAAMEGARQRIVAAALKMHYSRGEAEALAIKLLGVTAAAKSIPNKKDLKVQAITNAAHGDLKKLARDLAALHDKSINITARTFHVDVSTRDKVHAAGGYIGPGYRAGGMVRGYDVGGLVTGPGTGTSDSIPAPWLSNGEYVVKAAATAANRTALDAANFQGAQLMVATKSAWGKATASPWGNASIKPAASRPHAPAEVATVRYPAWWHGQASAAFGQGRANFTWGSTRPEMAAVAAAAKLPAPKSPWGNATYSPWGNASVAPRATVLKSDGSRHSDYLVSQLRQAIQAGGGDPAQFLAARA